MALVATDFQNPGSVRSIVLRSYSLNVSLFHILFLPAVLAAGLSIFSEWRKIPIISRLILIKIFIINIYMSIYLAPNAWNAFIGLIQLILLFVFYLEFRYLLIIGGNDFIEKCWKYTGVGVLLYIVWWAANLAIRWPRSDEWIVFAVPGVSNVRYVGFFSLAAFCAALAMFLTQKVRKDVIIATITLVLAGWGLSLWTGSRGAVVSLFSASLTAILLTKGDRLKTIGWISASFFIAIAVVYPLPYGSPEYGLSNFFFSRQSSDIGQLSPGRTEIWENIFFNASLRPWFGYGIDQFFYQGTGMRPGAKQPHNWVLQVYFSTGILGLVLLPLTLIPLVPWKRSVLLNRRNIPSVCCITGLLVYSMYDGAFYYLYPLTLAAMALASLQPPPAPDMSD